MVHQYFHCWAERNSISGLHRLCIRRLKDQPSWVSLSATVASLLQVSSRKLSASRAFLKQDWYFASSFHEEHFLECHLVVKMIIRLSFAFNQNELIQPFHFLVYRSSCCLNLNGSVKAVNRRHLSQY
jgi:hypothetical protein